MNVPPHRDWRLLALIALGVVVLAVQLPGSGQLLLSLAAAVVVFLLLRPSLAWVRSRSQQEDRP